MLHDGRIRWVGAAAGLFDADDLVVRSFARGEERDGAAVLSRSVEAARPAPGAWP